MINGGFLGAPVPTTLSTAPGRYGIRDYYRKQAPKPVLDLNDTWPIAPADPNFSSVQILCHFRNDQTVVGAFPILGVQSGGYFAARAGATGNILSGLSPTQSKWYAHSYVVGGTNGGAIQSAAPTAAGVGDFTIEIWQWFIGIGNNPAFIDFTSADGNVVAPFGQVSPTGPLRYFANVTGAVSILGTTTVTINTWHHIAVSRTSGTTSLQLDGTREGTFVDASNYVGQACYLGQAANSTNSLNGYFQDFRYTVGVGRYPGATYTVPTGPFPDY